MIGRLAVQVATLRYEREHARTARAALTAIERSTGQTASASLREEARGYAREVLGSAVYTPWLLVYGTLAGRFVPGWIPDDFHGRVVCPSVNGPVRVLSGIGTLNRRLFASTAFPDLAYVVAGRWYDVEMRPLAADRVVDLVFAHGDEVAVKVDGSSRGRGVRLVRRDAFDAAELARSAQRAVVQERVHQHAAFDAFVDGGTTTLRLTSAKGDDGTPRVRAMYARFPRTGDPIVRGGLNVRVAIDMQTHGLHPRGCLGSWAVVDAHPDTGTPFAGTPLPGLAAAVALCEELHGRLPQAGCIGWDVLIDREARPRVLEWNASHPDVKFSEAMTGPCFADLGWERLRPSRGAWMV